MGENLTTLLNNDHDLSELPNLVHFRDCIRKLKNKNCELLFSFFEKSVVYCNSTGELYEGFNVFLPRKKGIDQENIERRNVGLYSTAVCLDMIVQYKKELKTDQIVYNSFDFFSENNYLNFLNFITLGLEHKLYDKKLKPVTEPGPLSKINILIRLFSYYQHGKISLEKSIKNIANIEIISRISDTIFSIIKWIDDKKNDDLYNLHPYYIYKFIKMLELWGEELTLEGVDKNFYLCKFYNIAKYELYRQLSLKASGDHVLYDVKRLIYSLLIVYIDERFSNNLIREKALETIFETQRKEPNALWPVGQLLPISKDSMDSITSVECAYDLFEGDGNRALIQSICNYLPELKNFFQNVLRAAQTNTNHKIRGWYPLSQRDKTPTSWTTALALLYIKRYCKLLSFKIAKKAEAFFASNYRDTDIPWQNIYDSTAVKSKLRLMFEEKKVDEKTEIKVNLRTAMFFGPPGTGKTTLARAFANKLDWKYLELTPGDFYSGGENEILPKINNIFFNLMHLKETVVFIDEIDDLVIKRKQDGGFDRRTLYVNTLLPRFQEIHDKSEIILLASTNHFNNVDPAISRLGRFDLIIPVGPISEHGRIDLFFNNLLCKYDFLEKDKLLFENSYNCHKLLKVLLKRTGGYTFSQVKLFVDEIKKKINSKKKLQNSFINHRFIEDFSISLKINNFNPEIKSASDKQTLRFGNPIDNENVETDGIRPFSKFDYTDSTLIKADPFLREYKFKELDEKIKIDQIIDLYSFINIAMELVNEKANTSDKNISFLTLSEQESLELKAIENSTISEIYLLIFNKINYCLFRRICGQNCL